MRRHLVRAASAIFLFGTVGIGAAVSATACVGDDPRAEDGNGNGVDGGTGSEGGVGADGGTCKGDEPTACGASCTTCPEPSGGKATCTAGACGVECTAPATACGNACPVLAASGDHCGACGHSCGGGACLNSLCQPVPVVQGLVGAVAFAVAPTAVVVSMTNTLGACDLPAGCGNGAPKALAAGYKSMGPLTIADGQIYWIGGSQGDSDAIFLRKCPLAGCPAVPIQLDNDTNASINFVDVRGTRATWWRQSGSGQIRSCSLPDCTDKITVLSDPDLVTLVTDGTSIFYGRRGVSPQPPKLFKCPAAAVCTSAIEFTTGRVGGPAFREHKGLFFGVDPGEVAGIKDGYVWQASATAAGAAQTFAREEVGPTAIAVDDSGVYWMNPTLKTISTCPTTGCVGAPRVLAENQSDMKAIATDASFVYWLTSTAVYKIAK